MKILALPGDMVSLRLTIMKYLSSEIINNTITFSLFVK